jgi:peptidoglycan/LPS O-acetylase OafA/YrhL
MGETKNVFAEKFCTFLGDISYPIYILHFPFAYIFYAWVTTNQIPFGKGVVMGIVLLLLTTMLSYAALKLYDEPLRKWLAKRFMNPKN